MADMSLPLSSVPSTPSANPPQRGRTAAITPPPNGRSLSEGVYATPRAVRTVLTPTRPGEGRAGQRLRSRAPLSNADPFESSGGGGLSKNLTRRMEDKNFEAMHRGADGDGFGAGALTRGASPAPIERAGHGRGSRGAYRVRARPPTRRSDTDQTNELLRTILRNMQHLTDKVDRIEQTAEASRVWIERVEGTFDFHWTTDKKEESVDPSKEPGMLPARRELSDIWQKVANLESGISEARGLMEVQVVESKRLSQSVQGGYEQLVEYVIERAREAFASGKVHPEEDQRAGQDRKGKSRAVVQPALPRVAPPPPPPPPLEQMDWADDVTAQVRGSLDITRSRDLWR